MKMKQRCQLKENVLTGRCVLDHRALQSVVYLSEVLELSVPNSQR